VELTPGDCDIGSGQVSPASSPVRIADGICIATLAMKKKRCACIPEPGRRFSGSSDRSCRAAEGAASDTWDGVAQQWAGEKEARGAQCGPTRLSSRRGSVLASLAAAACASPSWRRSTARWSHKAASAAASLASSAASLACACASAAAAAAHPPPLPE
jgi:hypothetical protein